MVDSKDNYSSDLGSDTVFSCLFLSFFFFFLTLLVNLALHLSYEESHRRCFVPEV